MYSRHITLGGLYLPMVTRSNSLIGLTEFQLMLNFDLDIILISLQTSARLVSHSHIYNYKSMVTMILAMRRPGPIWELEGSGFSSLCSLYS